MSSSSGSTLPMTGSLNLPPPTRSQEGSQEQLPSLISYLREQGIDSGLRYRRGHHNDRTKEHQNKGRGNVAIHGPYRTSQGHASDSDIAAVYREQDRERQSSRSPLYERRPFGAPNEPAEISPVVSKLGDKSVDHDLDPRGWPPRGHSVPGSDLGITYDAYELQARTGKKRHIDEDAEVDKSQGGPIGASANYGSHVRRRTQPAEDYSIAAMEGALYDDTATDDRDDDESSSRYSPGRITVRETYRYGKPVREYYNEAGVKLEVVEIDVDYDKTLWLKHIREIMKPEGKQDAVDKKGNDFRCTWDVLHNAIRAPCEYQAKKHLVKRHIEATHMNIKRYMCSWCNKTFTQKSNVAGCHINTHTGEAPHVCILCGERFKDPSKRHKHLARCAKLQPRTLPWAQPLTSPEGSDGAGRELTGD